MTLGAFSVSLSVSDLAASRTFYEHLGFEVFGGDAEHGYLMMRQGEHVLGLFQGMFEGNLLTFNPGWDQHGTEVEGFTDVREIQRHLKAKGLALGKEADEATEGPESLTVTDPDGNVILIDQHV
ncbi:MAG: VOC family protein [Bacteroidota bacterium]